MGAYIKGFDEVVANLRATTNKNVALVNTAAIDMGGNLLKWVREQASLTDLSIEDLTLMGHPYSTRKGANSAPTPDDELHIQSGEVYQNIEMSLTTGEVILLRVGVDESNVPYIGELISGTDIMRPRDFLTGAFDEHRSELTLPLKVLFRG